MDKRLQVIFIWHKILLRSERVLVEIFKIKAIFCLLNLKIELKFLNKKKLIFYSKIFQ